MKEEEDAHEREDDDGSDDDRPLSRKNDQEEEEDAEESEGLVEKKVGGRRDRKRRRKDKSKMSSRQRKEEKKDAVGKKKAVAVDESVLDRADPADVMEFHDWPMPLPDDAGRVRAAHPPPGQVHEFWDYYEDLFRPVPEDLIRALTREPDLDTDPVLDMPRLGPHWAGGGVGDAEEEERDDALRRGAGRESRAEEEPHGPAGEVMTLRLLACLLPHDSVPSDAAAAGGDLASVWHGAASAAAAADAGTLAALGAGMELRVRAEMHAVGLLERADPAFRYDHPARRTDGPICAEIRCMQQQLRHNLVERERDAPRTPAGAAAPAPTATRKALVRRIEAELPRERLFADVVSAAHHMDALLAPKFRLAKGVKPHDIRRCIDTWDRAYARYRAHLALPPSRVGLSGARKPGHPAHTASLAAHAHKRPAGPGGPGRGEGKAGGGSWQAVMDASALHGKAPAP